MVYNKFDKRWTGNKTINLTLLGLSTSPTTTSSTLKAAFTTLNKWMSSILLPKKMTWCWKQDLIFNLTKTFPKTIKLALKIILWLNTKQSSKKNYRITWNLLEFTLNPIHKNWPPNFQKDFTTWRPKWLGKISLWWVK